MNFFDHPYYKSGKNVTRLIGRWPYQKDRESRICSFVVIFLCTSQFYAEVVGVIVHSDDKEIILESITPFMIDVLVTVKYINAILNVKTMVKLLDQLKENWTIYTKEEEKTILNEYAYIGQLIIYGYIVFIYVTAIMFVVEPLIPKWINYILQFNETIQNKYPVPIHWQFLDMEEHFYPIWYYESICIMAIVTITLANDSMFIVFLHHACALFTIVGRRLKNIPSQRDLEEEWGNDGRFRRTNDIQYDYYVMCIKTHKRAVQFAELLENMYVWCFGVVVAMNMLLLSVTAVQIATQADTIQKLIKYSLFTCSLMLHLFFECYLSQKLTDRSSAIQEYITHSNWYGMSLKTQKLITLVTLRSQVPCKLTAGKFILLSMETFGMIVKTSASYFTMMVSMR